MGPRDGTGQGQRWDDGHPAMPAMQLALIKAWQHSLRPTALFTLADGKRARMAFTNLVAGPIYPGSIAASSKPGEDGEGQTTPSLHGWPERTVSLCGLPGPTA